MSIFKMKQSFIFYQTFGNIYTIAPFCVAHFARAYTQTNFPPVMQLRVSVF